MRSTPADHEPALLDTQPPGPARTLLALAHGLTRHLADRAQATPPAEPVTGPELGAWLLAQRQARGWARREMARRLIDAGRAAGDTAMPGTDDMCRNIRRWESGRSSITERYKLHYCRALGITPGQFGPGQPAGLAALPAALARWLQTPATGQDHTAATTQTQPQPPAAGSQHSAGLDPLRAAWGDLYDITAAAARFRARRRDGTGPKLAADTPAQLNTTIRADWAATLPGTGPPASPPA